MHPFFDLSRHFGQPVGRAVLRRQFEDFRVIEQTDLALDGEGEHLWVRVRKQGITTAQLAKELAAWAGVRAVGVGFSGLKDKHAVTEQWLSLTLPGRADPPPPNADDWQILEQKRHRKKLRRGLHSGNQFEIRLREFDGDTQQLEQRLQQLREAGCPNYFGEQRFGRAGDNVSQAAGMFARTLKVRDRQLKGILISAARSHLFNQLLDQRVVAGNWTEALPGEVLMLAGSRSFFVADEIDETLQQRLHSGDVRLSGPLWGRGDSPASGQVAALEQQIPEQFAELVQGLAAAGLRQERRALRLDLADLTWYLLDRDLVVEFSLPSGSFATAVLREIIEWRY